MPTESRLHDDVAALLRNVGQRFTSGRREMVDALARLDRPVTVPELITSAPSVATSMRASNSPKPLRIITTIT
jgi:Fe2+ or Zn2+ uptake regulation protein